MTFNQLLQKLNLFFRLFVAPPKRWQLPKKSEVLIYDAAGKTYLLPYLTEYRTEILPLRGESVCVPCVLSAMKDIRFWTGMPLQAYADTYIWHVSPVIVLTWVDNNPEFYLLKARHPKVQFLSVQNAARSDLGDVFRPLNKEPSRGNSYRADYIIAFGSLFGAEYSKHIQGNVVLAGSLRNNLVPKQRSKVSGTLAFISQYRDIKRMDMGGWFYSFEKFFEQTDQLILSFLVEYAKAMDKVLYIVPCTAHYKDSELLEKEKRYYNRIAGCECAYSEWQWHDSSYDAIDSAEVVVSIDSTLGLEAAARGTKTAILSIRSRVLSLENSPYFNFGWPGSYPDDGPFWTNRPDHAAFERILDHLFAVSDEEWRAELQKERFSDVLQYDPGNSILRGILQSELGPGRNH
jgi:surface carbohydrate biosynthesis protein